MCRVDPRARRGAGWVGLLWSVAVAAWAFSFSEYEAAEQQEDQARQQAMIQQISTPCRAVLRNKKIAVLIGERHENAYRAVNYRDYGPHFDEINARLRQLGLSTYPQKDIDAQIAHAEMVAVLNNDPDAALAASQRLGAHFLLRGLIESRAHFNPVAGANEVFVELRFTLTGPKGRVISSTTARGDAWAGQDTTAMAWTLIRENAERIVADLYYDYCTQH